MSAEKKVDWQAGRSLDALVAERVLGWTRHPEQMHITDNRTINGVLYCLPEFPGIDLGGSDNCVPRYSTSIEDAWLIVEKLQESQMMLSLAWGNDGGWFCTVYPKSGPATDGPYADTAPLAICRAALLLTSESPA